MKFSLTVSTVWAMLLFCLSNTNVNAQTCLITTGNCSVTAFQACLNASDPNISLSGCSISGGTFSVPNNRVVTIQLNGGDVQGIWNANSSNTTIIVGGVTVINQNNANPNFNTLNFTYGGSLAAMAAALPVNLTRFAATAQVQQSVMVSWQTASEHQNRGFEVEWSTDAIQWQVLQFVPPTATETDGLRNYHYTHSTPSIGKNYYRLLQLDLDGTANRSAMQVAVIKHSAHQAFEVYPNPATQGFSITGLGKDAVPMQIFDGFGRQVLQTSIASEQDVQVGHLPGGTYRVMIETPDGVVYLPLVKAQ